MKREREPTRMRLAAVRLLGGCVDGTAGEDKDA